MATGIKDLAGRRSGRSQAADLGLLALRLGAGSVLAAHGAQKLFGSFQGPGLEGLAGFLGSIGLKPAKQWAALAGISEFGGGTLVALGLGGPLGPIAMQGAMATAIRQVHWKLPIWTSAGGAEVPILYSLIGVALASNGFGRYSLDHAMGIHVPREVSIAAVLGIAAGIGIAEVQIASAKRVAASTEPPASDETATSEDSDIPED